MLWHPQTELVIQLRLRTCWHDGSAILDAPDPWWATSGGWFHRSPGCRFPRMKKIQVQGTPDVLRWWLKWWSIGAKIFMTLVLNSVFQWWFDIKRGIFSLCVVSKWRLGHKYFLIISNLVNTVRDWPGKFFWVTLGKHFWDGHNSWVQYIHCSVLRGSDQRGRNLGHGLLLSSIW